jgi:hypothetical protein
MVGRTGYALSITPSRRFDSITNLVWPGLELITFEHCILAPFIAGPRPTGQHQLSKSGETLRAETNLISLSSHTHVPNENASSPQVVHSKVRKSYPGMSGSMRVIIMSSLHLGHGRREIGYWVVRLHETHPHCHPARNIAPHSK